MQLGIFDKLWSRLLKLYDNRIGIKWNWQSLDSISIKSPLGGRGDDEIILPTDSRSKLGSKRHDIFLQIKMVSLPLSTVITSANTHMMLLLQLIQLTV